MGRGEKREDKRGERGEVCPHAAASCRGGVATAVRSAFPLFVLPVFGVRRRPPSLCPPTVASLVRPVVAVCCAPLHAAVSLLRFAT